MRASDTEKREREERETRTRESLGRRLRDATKGRDGAAWRLRFCGGAVVSRAQI